MIKEKLSERISKEDFFDYLDESRKVDKMIDAIYQCSDRNLDLINFNDILTKPFRIIERNFFSNVELDIISWYLWEYKEGDMKIYRSDDREVIAELKTDEDLWEYLNRDDMECWKIVYPEVDEQKKCLKEKNNEKSVIFVDYNDRFITKYL